MTDVGTQTTPDSGLSLFLGIQPIILKSNTRSDKLFHSDVLKHPTEIN